MGNRLSQRYALTLAKYVEHHESLEDVISTVLALNLVFDSSRVIQTLMKNSTITNAQKRLSVERALGKQIPSTFSDFLLLLEKKQRIQELPGICSAFIDVINARRNVQKARIYAAHPLSDENQQRLKSLLETNYQKQFQIEVIIDPSLIGGFIIRIEDQVMDWSLKNKLHSLFDKLSA